MIFIDVYNFPSLVNELQVSFPEEGSTPALDLEDLSIDTEDMRDWLENGGHRESDDTSMDVTSIIQLQT